MSGNFNRETREEWLAQSTPPAWAECMELAKSSEQDNEAMKMNVFNWLKGQGYWKSNNDTSRRAKKNALAYNKSVYNPSGRGDSVVAVVPPPSAPTGNGVPPNSWIPPSFYPNPIGGLQPMNYPFFPMQGQMMNPTVPNYPFSGSPMLSGSPMAGVTYPFGAGPQGMMNTNSCNNVPMPDPRFNSVSMAPNFNGSF